MKMLLTLTFYLLLLTKAMAFSYPIENDPNATTPF